MSNNDIKNEKKSTDNKAVVGVEVVKDDTVVFEDGDFEEYNAKHDYEESTDDNTAKNETNDKDGQSEDESDNDEKSNKDKTSKKDSTEQDDKSHITMASIYQWASKIKDEFKSDASVMSQDVSEKATAMMLRKLIDAVDLELAAFDKSLEVAKNLVATAEERRKKIAANKEKYQGMIDKLDQE